ncbi:DUF3048 domain-containing protein [Micromonospora olivasterospora]|uniref:DUF3048 family protein n=1 Tax=Micromonospora olivasterospora TaxID=1880 RepID=A0A562I9E2_MICOL|nr:DUF3048 domain-containing protein [Micromonospora olivasterospora]TWH67345.1 Protein of unknown function (DUF3048) [Micromonospora olivasterospora]
MNRRRALGATVVAVLVAVAGAGCTEGQPPGATNLVDPGSPAPQPNPTPILPPAPLSGKPVAETVASRQAVVVPVRVTARTTPVGLAEADLVYQEFAESESLHLTAVYQSQDAARVGPVAEIRPVDIRTVGVLHPFIGYTGGPTGFLDQLAAAGLPGATPARRKAAFPSGQASTAALRQAAPTGGVAPTPVFDHADSGTPLASQGVTPASRLTVAAPGHPTQTWTYDAASSTWRGKIGKTTVSTASVVVLTTEYRTLNVRKPSPRSLPGAKVYGSGTAVVVSGPSSVSATWRKPGQRLVCNVIDPGGYQVRLQPGTAWVIYAPETARVNVA